MRFYRWIKNLIGQFAFFRKLMPGHWELWTLPYGHGDAWLRVNRCFFVRGRAPDPRLLGLPRKCEHYWSCDCQFDQDTVELVKGMRCPVCHKPIEDHELCQHIDTHRFRVESVHRICTGQMVLLMRQKS